MHNVILIEVPLAEIDEHVAQPQACMRAASRIVLGGLELGSDAKLVRWPERYSDKRYSDKRGEVMWYAVVRLLF